jgi:hypothetical protein
VEGKSIRITGFTFRDGSTNAINISGTCKTFRIDHIKFDNLTNRGVAVDGYTYGVIDHCQFVGTNVFPGVLVREDTQTGGVASWKRPLALGTDKAVYVEDCTFEFVNFAGGRVSIDSSTGSRWVFRHNHVKNQNIGWHDANTGTQRGSFSWEVYDNVIEYDVGVWTAMVSRGGTGVMFNNKFIAPIFNWGSPIYITNYRSVTGNNLGAPWTPHCDGVRDYMWSDVSGNCTTPGEVNSRGATCVQIDGHLDSTGYPCIDQLGRSCDTYGDGIQDLEPAYIWNNTNGDGTVVYPLKVPATVSMHLKEGRDFFNGIPRPGYTPYVYPHPLATDESFNVTDKSFNYLIYKRHKKNPEASLIEH